MKFFIYLKKETKKNKKTFTFIERVHFIAYYSGLLGLFTNAN